MDICSPNLTDVMAGHEIVISKSYGFTIPMVEELVSKGHLGVKSSKGFYDYQGRSEEEITAKRDGRLIKVADMLKKLKTQEPI